MTDAGSHVDRAPLLEKSEPGPCDVVNPDGQAQVLLLCDHASNRIPGRLGNLGLAKDSMRTHIAWDPGAAMVARHLSGILDAPLVLSGYSRLVIDCNRSPHRIDSIPTHSAGVRIPGNENLTSQEREQRCIELLEPYHSAIGDLLDVRGSRTTSLISIHSFTPYLQGHQRPWHIGVCYGSDTRLAELMLRELRSGSTSLVGDNEPYTIEADVDFTLPRHGSGRSLPHVMIEIRQDQITTEGEAGEWSRTLAEAWSQVRTEVQQLNKNPAGCQKQQPAEPHQDSEVSS